MDTDGDKVLLTAQPEIIDAVYALNGERLPMVYGDTKQKEKDREYRWGKDGFDAYITYDRKTLSPSQIGIVTNYCTAFADRALAQKSSDETIARCWDVVTIGRVIQGRIIDDAKKGTETVIPESLETQLFPHWLRDNRTKEDQMSDDKSFPSSSPMGKLFDYVCGPILERVNTVFSDTDMTEVKLFTRSDYDIDEVIRVEEYIAVLDRNYRLEMMKFMEENPEPNKDLAPEEYKKEMQAINERRIQIIDKHKDILSSIDATPSAIAVASVKVAEKNEGRSADKANSYPYVIANEYMEAWLKGMNGRYKLVRVNKVDEDLWTEYAEKHDEEKPYVVRNGRVKWANHIIGRVDVSDGEYEQFSHEGKFYIKVPVQAEKEEIAVSSGQPKNVQFTIKGWKYYDATKEDMFSLVKAESVTTELFKAKFKRKGEETKSEREMLAIVLDGKRVATCGDDETSIFSEYTIGKKMTVTNVQEYRGVLIVDATVNGDMEIKEVSTAPSEPITEPQTDVDDDMMWFGEDLAF